MPYITRLPGCDVIMKTILNNVGVATKVSMMFNPHTINAHSGQKQPNNFVEIFRTREYSKNNLKDKCSADDITDNFPSNIV